MVIKHRFLNKPRQKWLAKYFNNISLVASAGVVSETFIRFRTVWRILLVTALVVSFLLGLFFAKAEGKLGTEEE